MQSIGHVVSAFGPDGAMTTDVSDIHFWQMLAALGLFINGILGVILGYMACVHDFSHPYLTFGMNVIIQWAWMTYLGDSSYVGMMANDDPSEQGLIPIAYDPSQRDVRFVAAMGVMGVLNYGFAYMGAFSFMTFCLHKYNTQEYQQRTAEYFRGRLGFYSASLALAGLVQLMLGAYCASNFGGMGVLEYGPIQAAMLIVNYPSVAIAIGMIQIIHGLWGLARSMGFHSGPNDSLYQVSMMVQWILVLCLQIVMQLAYLPGPEMAAAAATVTGVSFGINMMPAFLDQKMRNTPEVFPQGYYFNELQPLKESSLGFTNGSDDSNDIRV